MDYQTFPSHPDLSSIVKLYWTLEVPAAADAPRQRIVPDGCIEMAFILGDDIKRYTSDTQYVWQPRAMVLGQITTPLYIQPAGRVDTFAVRFYPYGFANLTTVPLSALADRETPLTDLFGKEVALGLQEAMERAGNTQRRIDVIETFLRQRLQQASTLDAIVKSTVDAFMMSGRSLPIKDLVKEDPAKRRQLERKFSRLVGISPKQLGRVIRLQAALKMLLHEHSEALTQVAYDADYYDQPHFIRDFRALTGTTPTAILKDEHLQLSIQMYKNS